MPTFCRHNRFLANCPICSPPRAPAARRSGSRSGSGTATRKQPSRTTMRVRQVERPRDDGFRSQLAPGLKASADAERLAEEIAFASARLAALAGSPSGLYGDAAALAREGDREEATWLALLIAYLGPLEEGEDPFAGVRAARVPWAGGSLPVLDGVALGPRTAHDAARGEATFAAYRAWAARAGSQADAFTGEAAWSPERRFARLYERLALPGLGRDARFELLATLGLLGVYELTPDAMHLGGPGETTVAAKRVLGIGDTLLLERRAAELADVCAVPLAALDVALWNWARPARATLGFPGLEPDDDASSRVAHALGL